MEAVCKFRERVQRVHKVQRVHRVSGLPFGSINFICPLRQREAHPIALPAVSGAGTDSPTIQKAGKGSPFLLFYQSSLK
jgi:hypothetical protein